MRLVPGYDEYLLGWRTREPSVAEPYRLRVHPGGGVLRPVLIVDGKVLGVWRIRRTARTVDIDLEPFETLTGERALAVTGDAADIGRFLGTEARLRVRPGTA